MYGFQPHTAVRTDPDIVKIEFITLDRQLPSVILYAF